MPAIGNDYEIFIPAPASTGFEHGRYELRHLLYLFNPVNPGVPGNMDEYSPGAAFTVDRIAPYGSSVTREPPTVVEYPADLPPGTSITKSYLDTHGGVTFTVPDNNFPIPSGRWEPGDVIRYYWSPNMFPQAQYLVGAVAMLQTGNTFLLLASDITVNGLFYFFYTITDLAGNESRPSNTEGRVVSLLDEPERLAPFIPLAPAPEDGSTDDLINIQDYLAGVEVWVRMYEFHQPTLDRIQVQWGAQPWGALSPPFSIFPEIFRNLNDAIKAEYADRFGPQLVSVRYRISRGGELFLSFDKDIFVDLSVEGPINPGEPGSDNPNLNPVRIFGEDSNELNVLRIGDANLPVTARIRLWTVAQFPQAGQFVTLLWGKNKEVAGPPFEITTELPGDEIDFTFGWDVVANNGNGLQDVCYIITGPGTTNPNPSPLTTVDVIDAVTLDLPPPEFQRLQGGMWTCASLLPPNFHGEIHIPGDPSRFVEGNEVTLTLRVYRPRTGPVEEENTGTFRHTWTAATVVNGFTFIITPFHPLIATSQIGGAEATYTTVVQSGATGRGTVTVPARSVLSNSYCDLTSVP